jgi:hypothetical protein
VAVSDHDVARLAWAQLDHDNRAEILAAIQEHHDMIAPELHPHMPSAASTSVALRHRRAVSLVRWP